MDSMLIITTTIGWIHIMAVAVVIGGSYFMNFIIKKVAKDMPVPEGGQLKKKVGPLFGQLAGIMTLLIIVTGVVRSVGMGLFTRSVLIETGYGNLLIAKLIITTIIVLNSVLMTRNGIKLAALTSAEGQPDRDAIGSISKQQDELSMTSLALAAVAVACAVAMRMIGSPV